MLTHNRIPLKKNTIVLDNNEIAYRVYDIISEGGNAITYDVTLTTNDRYHSVLKEFYPIEFAHRIIRDEDGNLIIPDDVEIQELRKHFENEGAIQDRCLPDNNSPDGKYFFYITGCFQAKGTSYILINTEDCKPLAKSDCVNTLPKLLSAMQDVCCGLKVLHQKALYLDVSDTNILITDAGAKLTDFGSLFLLDGSDSVENHYYSYTAEFSPVEVISASQGGYITDIDASADTYSVCSVLFKYAVGRIYDPVFDRELEADWKIVLRQKYQSLYGKSITNELISILQTGLTSRYKTAAELYSVLGKIIRHIKQFEHDRIIDKNIGIIMGSVFGAITLLTLLVWCIFPRPEIVSVSGVDASYFDGDDITLKITICDTAGINSKHIFSIHNKITLEGFSAAISLPTSSPPKKNTDITYTVLLSDVEIVEDGPKSITIGEIYQTQFFAKKNKPKTISFDGYVEEPKVIISEPNFSKVNSEAGHSVTYTVEFQVPEGQEAEIDLSNVDLKNFSCSSADSKQVGQNKYEITFSGISGSTGICSFSIYEGTCKLKTGAYNKETASPSFEIVDNEVSNQPMHMYLHVVSQDIRDGGYILLEHGTYSGQEFFALLDESMIHLDGFAADVCFEYNSYILLDNLSLGKEKDLLIRADAGAYVSKENGSYSDAVQCKPIERVANDSTIPTVAMMQLGKASRNVKSGGDLILVIFGDDETNCFLNKKTDMLQPRGFSYDDCQISVMGLTIRVVYTGVKSLGNNDEKCYVVLKDGTFKDFSGNESRQVEFSFTITP